METEAISSAETDVEMLREDLASEGGIPKRPICEEIHANIKGKPCKFIFYAPPRNYAAMLDMAKAVNVILAVVQPSQNNTV